MSAMTLTNAADPAVRNLAYDVLTTQQSQIGTVQGWLTLTIGHLLVIFRNMWR